MNSLPKYVVSTTLDKGEWNNSTVISGDVAAAVAKLKDEPGNDIIVAGSATLVRFLMEHDLVDEYRLMVHPVVLGTGKRLFADAKTPRTLELVDARSLGTSGMHALTYRAAR
jgi:dihydrofolate reductase